MARFLSLEGPHPLLTRSRRAESRRLCTRMGAPSSAGVCDRTSSRFFPRDPNRSSPDARCRTPPDDHHPVAWLAGTRRTAKRTQCLASGSTTNTCPSNSSRASRVGSRSIDYHYHILIITKVLSLGLRPRVPICQEIATPTLEIQLGIENVC